MAANLGGTAGGFLSHSVGQEFLFVRKDVGAMGLIRWRRDAVAPVVYGYIAL